MPIDRSIANPFVPGGDVPQIMNYLNQQKQAGVENALRDRQLTGQENLVAFNQKRLLQQDQQQQEAAQAQAEADKSKAGREWGAQVLPIASTHPDRIPTIIAVGKRLGHLPPEFPDTISPEQVAQLSVQLGEVQGLSAEEQFRNSPKFFENEQDFTNKRKLEYTKEAIAKRSDTAGNRNQLVQTADGSFVWADPYSKSVTPAGIQGPKKSGDDPTKLRKEFRNLPSVQSYETVAPIISAAKVAPDTGAGDLQMIYSVGKILDPNSVVREGELALIIDSQSMLSKIFGEGRLQLGKGGRIRPEQRAQMMDILNDRENVYRKAYERDFNQYAEYAKSQNLDPGQVTGTHFATAFEGGSSSGVNADVSNRVNKYLERAGGQ